MVTDSIHKWDLEVKLPTVAHPLDMGVALNTVALLLDIMGAVLGSK